jgi:transposase
VLLPTVGWCGLLRLGGRAFILCFIVNIGNIIVQDYEAKFLHYGAATALCGAHLTRELKGLAELEKIPWAGQFREFMFEMNAQKTSDLSCGNIYCPAEKLEGFGIRYDELVAQGQAYLATLKPKTYIWDKLSPMIKRLQQRKAEYMRFMRDYTVPFTNNQAERDLRHCKTKQKISGCYRSWSGLVDYCNLRSFIDSSRKRGECVFDRLSAIYALPLHAGQ